MRVLITGANGFIAKNLRTHLAERSDIDVVTFTREQGNDELNSLLKSVDFIFHLAGVNRPEHNDEFKIGNTDLTHVICSIIDRLGLNIHILYTSSIQAEFDNPYGSSKLAAENILKEYSVKTGAVISLFRLPNVFGKWCKPNYNSAVATFCHNIAHELPIQINDASSRISLVYIDDVVRDFIKVMDSDDVVMAVYGNVQPVYQLTVGELAEVISAFNQGRTSLITERVGEGFERVLHATYLSYLEPDKFSYPLIKHSDPRGMFVEMLKTKDSGQISYFTAYPGVTRGGHYHHTKTEKFLVVKGHALFKFRHVDSNDYYEVSTTGDEPMIVETVPGWSHDVTNVGNDEMIVMLWANEIFDPENPDTFTYGLD